MANTIEFVFETEDGEECVHDFPAAYVVCATCCGEGSHVNRNIDGNGITSSEWAEWDDEEKDHYMRGDYDVPCEECHGQRVTLEIDESVFTAEDRRVFELYEERQQSEAESRACERAEQRYFSRFE